MAGYKERKCPGCGKTKKYRIDQLTCGCRGSNPQLAGGGPVLQEQNEKTKDTWAITLPKTRIHTLDGLLEAFEVDQTIWEVERFIANKWEMGFIQNEDSTTTQQGKGFSKTSRTAEAGHEPLFQVKAFLRRKKFTALEEATKDNTKLRCQLERARRELKSERSLAKQLASNHSGHDDLLKEIQTFTESLGDFKLPFRTVQPANPKSVPAVGKGHTEDAVLVISDTHFGDVIRADDTSGFPEFDLEIAGNRFGYVIEKAKQVLSLHRAMYPIKTLYMPILGDIGNGILHDAPQSNALFTPAQVYFSYHMLRLGLEDLLTLVEAGTVEEIKLLFSVGNHMRLDEKMPTKYQAQRTLDWLIYQFVIDKFKDTKHVSIHTEMSPFIFENIRGHRYLFTHGNQVGYRNRPEKQAGAISSFTAMVRALFDSPIYRRATGLQGETFSRAVIGDIHVPVSFPRLLSNGSLNGQNELGVNWGLEPIPAGMQLFGVSEAHIQTWGYFLDCTMVQRENPNSYALFAKEFAEKFGRW